MENNKWSKQDSQIIYIKVKKKTIFPFSLIIRELAGLHPKQNYINIYNISAIYYIHNTALYTVHIL